MAKSKSVVADEGDGVVAPRAYSMNKYPTCPFCDYEEKEWWDFDLSEGNSEEITCSSCEHEYFVEMEVANPTFTTYTVAESDGEK